MGERLLSPSNPEGEGRSQIKVCGLISEPIADLTTCTFQLNDPSFAVTFNPAIYDLLSPNRGGKAREVTFQSNERTRPTLKGQFKAKGAQVDFCINIDRAEVSPAPAGIDIEPCTDGQQSLLNFEFDVNCADADITFDQAATWRVPRGTCATNDGFPNMRTP